MKSISTDELSPISPNKNGRSSGDESRSDGKCENAVCNRRADKAVSFEVSYSPPKLSTTDGSNEVSVAFSEVRIVPTVIMGSCEDGKSYPGNENRKGGDDIDVEAYAYRAMREGEKNGEDSLKVNNKQRGRQKFFGKRPNVEGRKNYSRAEEEQDTVSVAQSITSVDLPVGTSSSLAYIDRISRKDRLQLSSKKKKIKNREQLLSELANSTADEEKYSVRDLAESLYSKKKVEKFPLNEERVNLITDFEYARKTRRQIFGADYSWGVPGLYEHLKGIRTDIQWAEEVAWRKKNMEPYMSWSDFNWEKARGGGRSVFINLLVFVFTFMLILSMLMNGWVIEPFEENPMIGPSVETLISLGANTSTSIVNEGEGWRLLSSMVLHAGVMHYIANMLALVSVGAAIEKSHGTPATIVIFCLPAIGGNIISAIFLPKYVSVGSSGGIFGLLGACVADITIHRSVIFNEDLNEQRTFENAMIVLCLILDVLFNLLIGLTPLLDNFTHLGGLLYGFLCGMITMERISTSYFSPKENGASTSVFKNIKKHAIIIVSMLLVMSALAASSIVLLEGDGETSPCPTCQSLSCVALPPWKDEDKKWWYCDSCNNATVETQLDNDSGLYEQLYLQCLSGEESTYIELGDQATNSMRWIEQNVPRFCREYCDV